MHIDSIILVYRIRTKPWTCPCHLHRFPYLHAHALQEDLSKDLLSKVVPPRPLPCPWHPQPPCPPAQRPSQDMWASASRCQAVRSHEQALTPAGWIELSTFLILERGRGKNLTSQQEPETCQLPTLGLLEEALAADLPRVAIFFPSGVNCPATWSSDMFMIQTMIIPENLIQSKDRDRALPAFCEGFPST